MTCRRVTKIVSKVEGKVDPNWNPSGTKVWALTEKVEVGLGAL